jgi:hypothetical protein
MNPLSANALLRLLSCLLVLAGTAENSRALITVHVNGGPGERVFQTAGGGAPATDAWFLLGTFPAAMQATLAAQAPASILDDFIPFGSLRVRTIAGQSGSVAGSLDGDESKVGSMRMYTWVFLTRDGAAPASDFSNVTQTGLFTSSAAAWTFSASAALPSPLISTSEVNQSVFGAITAGALVMIPVNSPPRQLFDGAMAVDLPGSTAAQRAPDADPDRDGVPNGIEYLWGSDPSTPTRDSLTTAGSEASFTLTYPRRAGLPAGLEALEGSTLLQTWTPVPAADQTVTSHPDGTVSITVPASAGFRYFRLAVTFPTP